MVLDRPVSVGAAGARPTRQPSEASCEGRSGAAPVGPGSTPGLQNFSRRPAP